MHLSSYHPDLNPIEKNLVSGKGMGGLEEGDVKNVGHSVNGSSQKMEKDEWMVLCKHVIDLEKEYTE